jgi:hypothetical protein
VLCLADKPGPKASGGFTNGAAVSCYDVADNSRRELDELMATA